MIKRITLFALLPLLFMLGCSGSTQSDDVAITVDLRNYQNIHIDWINFDEDNWRLHGYGTIEEWKSDIRYLNEGFQVNLKKYWLPGKNLSFSTGKFDNKFPGKGLLITFDDITIDYDNYYLYLSMAFTDLQTKQVLVTIEKLPYYGNQWGFTGFLSYALDEVSKRITWLVVQEEKPNLLN